MGHQDDNPAAEAFTREERKKIHILAKWHGVTPNEMLERLMKEAADIRRADLANGCGDN